MALQASDIIDLLNLTLPRLGRMKMTEMATDIQEFVALPSLMRRERVDATGESIEWRILKSHSGAAKNVGLFNQDDLNVVDNTVVANIPWRHTTTNYSFDERETAMNSGPAQIFSLIKTRRADAKIALTELIEQNFWSKPVDSSDTKQPFGVFYYLVSSTTEGFNGGNPAGFSAGAANIDSATVTRWANYTNQYVLVSRGDLQKKLRKAMRKTTFKSPVQLPRFDGSDRFVIYVNEAVITDMEELAEEQNDRIGFDLNTAQDRVRFNRNPLFYVPELDSDTTNPVIGLNWGTFKFCVLPGFFLKESGPRIAPTQHNVVENHVDLSWNLKCYNRRRNFLLTL